MTKRSIVVGLLLAALLSGVTFFNDEVMKGTNLIGHFLPPSVFGAVLLMALFFNPVLGRIWPRAVFSGRELAAVMGILLFVCYMPGRGLMHYFTTFLMLPHHHERTTPGWRGEPAEVEAGQVRDGARLVAELRSAAGAAPDTVAGCLWRRLPADLQARLRDGAVSADGEGDRAALIAALNAAVDDPGFAAAVRTLPEGLPPHAHVLLRRSPEARAPEDVQRLNRALLDTSFSRALAWRRAGVLESVPRQWLADPRRDSTRVLDGFVTGLAQGDERIPLSAVPWFAWWRTMAFWIPLILTVCVMCTGLALVVHRQWSANEHLPYPTVEFACAILPPEGESESPMLRSRLFWIGAGVVFAIHLSNYAAVWWPDYVIPVKTKVDLSPLVDIFTTFKKGSWWAIFTPTLCFTAIGFAFFLASDVSLSLGIAPYVYVLATAVAAGYGVAVDSGHLRPATEPFLYAGGYVGMFLVLAYTGRHHYRTVFSRALGLSRAEVDGDALRGARVFYVAFAAFIVQLLLAGVEFPMALLYTLGMLLLYVVISRLLAEAGVFFIHPYTFPCAVMWGFMGAAAAGQGQLLLLGMLSSLLLIDPREAFMPFAVTATNLASRRGNSPVRGARWGLVALAVGFAVAVPACLYWQYQMGAIRAGDGWTVGNVPKFAFDLNTEIGRTLEAQDNLLASQQIHGWARFAHMHAQPRLVVAFLITFSLTLAFSFFRHRFARWPLHPLIFIVLGTWQSRTLGFSFLLGWAVKAAVMKYGGVPAYRRLKPVMIGLVAGDVLAAVVTLIAGAIYYQVTGTPPKPFSVFPG